MFKISKPIAQETIVDYHREQYSAGSEANYYSENGKVVGSFHGKLADEFGLLDKPATEERISRLAAGQHPETGEQLVKHRTAAAKEEPWGKTPGAWREFLEVQFADALVDGRDPFREVDGREAWKPAELKAPEGGLVIPERTKHELLLIRMQEVAAGFYTARLAAAEGKAGREYLDSRHITEESRAAFRLGFSGYGNELLHHMQPQFSREQLLESGLFYARESDGALQDRFKSRVMFPIQDASGAVIAFAGRRIDNNKDRKYINSPTTPIYRKGEILYNMHRAAAASSGRLVIVEGQLDAIQSHQAGVRDVVALGGVALTANAGIGAVDQIRKVAHTVVLNLDGNAAGRLGTEKHIPALLEAGLRVRALSLAEDPDKFAIKHGAAKYAAEVDRARPLVEWLASRASEEFKVGEVYGKVDALRWVTETLSHVRPEHREEMAAEVARYLKTPTNEAAKPKHVEHRAAIDAMFAPPKSFSIQSLVGGALNGEEIPGDGRLVESHNRAVRVALDSMQRYTQARMRDTAPYTSENWCAALFLHDTSRPVGDHAPNPQLHTHAVIFNMTSAADKIRSMDPSSLYRIQTYGNAVYMAEMACDARKYGYVLERGKNFSMEIAGYSKEYLAAMSLRRDDIEEEMELRGVTGEKASDLVTLERRQAKQNWEPEALRAEHRREAEAFGQNPALVESAARERGGFVLPAEKRADLANKALDYARERLFEGQAVNDHYELMRDALRYQPDCLREKDIQQAFESRRGEFVQVGHYRADAPGERYTTPEMEALERESIQIVLRGQGKTAPIAAGLTRDQFREGYRIREVKGKRIELNDQQMWMAYRVLTSPHQYMIVAGAAGVGKSSTFEAVAEIAEQHRAAGYQVVGMAATSSATNNLRAMGIGAQTLQGHIARGVKPGASKTLYLLDEGSLVGSQSLRKFLDTVRPQDRVIIAYDHRQHHSVEAGRIVKELEDAGVQTIRLEQIVRQRESPELLAVIEKFRDSFGPRGSQNMIEGLQMLDAQDRVHEVPHRVKRFAAIADYYSADWRRSLIVSPDNRSIAEINLAVRAKLQELGYVKPDAYEAIVLTGVRNVKAADKKRATTYEEGNVIRWGKSGTLGGRGRVSAGQYTTVVGVSAESNEVTIRVGDALGVRDVTYDPRNGTSGELYESGIRQLAVGDKVQITRPWTLRPGDVIANRDIGTIVSIDREGDAELDFDGRRVAWNVREMPHADYGYAMTSYSAQSATVPRVAVHIDTGDSRIRALIEKALMYVGASRGAEDVAVFTDDRDVLLSERESPVLRQHDKPMALPAEEVEEIGAAMRVA
jgi:DNA primase catalytic core